MKQPPKKWNAFFDNFTGSHSGRPIEWKSVNTAEAGGIYRGLISLILSALWTFTETGGRLRKSIVKTFNQGVAGSIPAWLPKENPEKA